MYVFRSWIIGNGRVVDLGSLNRERLKERRYLPIFYGETLKLVREDTDTNQNGKGTILIRPNISLACEIRIERFPSRRQKRIFFFLYFLSFC